MKQDMPVTVKRSIELLGLTLLVFILYTGKELIMPLVMSFFLALILLPIHRWLMRHRVPEVISITLSIVSAIIIIGSILVFFGFQVSLLVQDYPELEKNVNANLSNLTNWIASKTEYSVEEQMEILRNQSSNLLKNAGAYLSGFMASATGIFIFLGLIPIYTFLFLFYKNLLLRFVFLWFKRTSHEPVEDALRETEVMVKSYLVGLMIQIGYITVLLGCILLLLGIKHAMLIGILFALLNLIPYVGALIGNLLAVLLTLSSSTDGWQVLTVLIVIAVVQFLDNNILMPRIVGSKVKINALVSIMGVVLGGMIAGVSGMFLSLPIMATLKIIFDRTEEFNHWGFLLGDERPKLSPMTNHVVRWRNKHKREPLPETGSSVEKKEESGNTTDNESGAENKE